MPLTRRTATTSPGPDTLAPELRRLLLEGPQAIGKTLHQIPDHDQLRELWRLHGAALLASKDCPKKPWFPQRDWFVTIVRALGD